MRWILAVGVVFVGFQGFTRADGPQDNVAEKVRPVPPPGIKISDEDRASLQKSVEALNAKIAALAKQHLKNTAMLRLIPDVVIFRNAVAYALKYDEFYDSKEVGVAYKLAKLGDERAEQLAKGKAPWLSATGLVVRGYRSKIDDSVQPYGLVVPKSFRPDSGLRHRLDFWYHGRGEKLTELSFLNGRLVSMGPVAPANAFVLHPYGRYCCANHLAGEIDALEALEHAKHDYAIDEDRIVVRGFSMGGAACWNYAVHYADRWAAAAPGAGFSETPDFLKVFQKEKLEPTWYEKKLWHLYDCTDWAENLSQLPTVAYSGEVDSQKQAADIMAKAMLGEGLRLTHIIGPKTGHSYEPKAQLEINRRIDAIAQRGRDPIPAEIRFTTYTLRYPSMYWVHVDGIAEHWERAQVHARIQEPRTITAATRNVTRLTLSLPAGQKRLPVTLPVEVFIDGQAFKTLRPESDGSWRVSLAKKDGKWHYAGDVPAPELRKVPGLQGPIDDAFMDRFVFVEPTGQALNPKVDEWVAKEFLHAVDHWRKQFRGELKTRKDTDVSPADIANANLVLWGDPSSNKVLGQIADKLPICWTKEGVVVGDKTYPSANHVPVLIFPNPMNPKKYVVVNSSFTFREYDYLNNARQVPKLPDWAILDVNQPATPRRPAGVVNAGFFDEEWKLKASTK